MIPVVHVERSQNLLSSTLSAPEVNRLASAFRIASRWRDRWKDANFRTVAGEIASEHGGLVLLGPLVPFQVPPPFNEMFEPIEIGSARGGNDDQLNTLSADPQASVERRVWLKWLLVGVGILLLVVPLFFLPMRGIPVRGFVTVVLAFASCGLLVCTAYVLEPNRDRWFIIPGAIAVVPRPTRRNRAPRLAVLSPKDACLIIRHVKSGDSFTLVLEMWTHAEETLRCAVSEREAVAILAAWQSSHPRPPEERLHELGAR